jgi:hypothetical protein
MKEETKAVYIRIPISLVEESERIAKKRNMKSAEVMRMCLDIGLQAHKDMESIGIIGVVDLAYYVKEAIKTKVSTGRQLTLPNIG